MAVLNEAAPADVTPVAPTLVDGVALALRAEGITVVTNLPDDVTIVIAESFLRNGFRVVRPRHEQNVILAADGYTRASGLPAVCVVGPGPGIAQTGTGLVTASRRRSPVLVIVGERPSIRGDDKDLDIQRFVESTGARYLEMRSELTLADDLHEAMRQVRLRRGPVVLNLVDVRLLEKPLSSAWSYSPTEDVVPTGIELDPQSSVIDDVAGLLTWSRRTIILAGAGAASARDDIVKLADRTGALLASSMQSRSLFRDHPRFIGIFGNFSTDQATELIAEADCVLALGVSLNTHQIGFAPSTRLVQVDIDPTRIGEYATPHISILADAGAAVRAINGLLAQADAVTETSLWEGPSYSERLKAARTPPALPAVEERTDGRLQLSIALNAIDRILPEDRLVVIDGGYYVPFVFDRISIPDEGSWIWTIDFASIGLGLGMSIGTTIARPERHVVLFVGDGGLSMSIQELETIVREEIKLIVVVLNDAAYHAEGLDLHGESKELALFRDVDFAAVATAFGGQAVTMRGLDDTATVAAAIAKHEHGLLLIDVKVEENEPHRLWLST